MIAVVQRVTSASVLADGVAAGQIGHGLAVLVGIHERDTAGDAEWMALRLVGLRVFKDEAGKMNLSLAQVEGSILLIPNFTLCAQAGKGHRPSFIEAMAPEQARALFEDLQRRVGESGLRVEAGVFGADMRVSLENDGPVTLVLDSSRFTRPGQPTQG